MIIRVDLMLYYRIRVIHHKGPGFSENYVHITALNILIFELGICLDTRVLNSLLDKCRDQFSISFQLTLLFGVKMDHAEFQFSH